MKFAVDCLMRYKSEHSSQTDNEWSIRHAKRIIKGEKLNRSFTFRLRGVDRNFKINESPRFRTYICHEVSRFIVEKYGTVGVVAVPNSSAVEDNAVFFIKQLVSSVAALSDGRITAVDLFRWKENKGKSHEGRKNRDVAEHVANLRLLPHTPDRVVLFDDFVTTGSQMGACKSILEAAGFEVVGLCALFENLGREGVVDYPAWTETTRELFVQDALF